MAKLPRILLSLLGILVLILLLSSLPSILSYGRPSIIQWYSNAEDPDFMGSRLYKLHVNPDNLWRKPFLYFRLIASGEVFDYNEGRTHRDYMVQAPRYASVSLYFVTISAVTSLVLGLFICLKNVFIKRNSLGYEFLSIMTIFPDFILIFVIQFLFSFLNKALGSTIVKTHSLHGGNRALLLPLIVMCCYPTLYIVRSLGSQLKDQAREPHIAFCRAKGLSERQIRFFHIGPAAVHLVKADLHKILGIIFANLFITEMMFNNKGITAFLFNNINEYNATVNTLILMVIIYGVVYILLQGLLSLLGFFLRREWL